MSEKNSPDWGDHWSGRGRLLLTSMTALTLAVSALVVWRLRNPLPEAHMKPGLSGVTLTFNPYRGAAGTVRLVDNTGVSLGAEDTLNDRFRSDPTTSSLEAVTGSPALAAQLTPLLRERINENFEAPAAGELPRAHDVALSLLPALQQELMAAAHCYTGGEQSHCAGLPRTVLESDSRFRSGAAAPRAGMLGYILASEDDGAVIAMGGAWSECSVRALKRTSTAIANGSVPIFASPQENCPQFPDARHANWLGYDNVAARDLEVGRTLQGAPTAAAPDPSQLPLPGGSTEKIKLAIACEAAGLMTEPLEVARERFARSKANDWFKELALRCVEGYRTVYKAAAVRESMFPQWDKTPAPWSIQAWPKTLPAGRTISPEQYLALDGTAARSRKARLVMPMGMAFETFDRSRNITSIAIGNGDNQGNLAHRLSTMRWIGLQSRGIQRAPRLHIARDMGLDLPSTTAPFALTEMSAQRVLSMLNGVTSEIGTARSACLRVFPNCPKAGWPTLSGKTGTSDVEDEKNPGFVKRGFTDPLPVRHFVARVQIKGKWFVLATHALRTRNRGKLDDTNPAAEFGLVIVEALGRKS